MALPSSTLDPQTSLIYSDSVAHDCVAVEVPASVSLIDGYGQLQWNSLQSIHQSDLEHHNMGPNFSGLKPSQPHHSISLAMSKRSLPSFFHFLNCYKSAMN